MPQTSTADPTEDRGTGSQKPLDTGLGRPVLPIKEPIRLCLLGVGTPWKNPWGKQLLASGNSDPHREIRGTSALLMPRTWKSKLRTAEAPSLEQSHRNPVED